MRTRVGSQESHSAIPPHTPAISRLRLDQSFGRTDAFALADGFAAGEDEPGPATLVIPTTGATRDGQSVLLPTDGAEDLLSQLRDFDTVVRFTDTFLPSSSPNG